MNVEKNNTNSTYNLTELTLEDVVELLKAFDSCNLQQKAHFYNVTNDMRKIIKVCTQPKKKLWKS